MKRKYTEPSVVPLSITVETGVMAASIEMDPTVKVTPYEDGFKDFADLDGFDADGGFTINF